MNEDKEKKLVSLMAVRRSEAFWERQKDVIRNRASAPSRPRAWLLVPAAAAAALAFMLVRPADRLPPPETAVSTAFLENLDMLDDLDVLEAIPEEELI